MERFSRVLNQEQSFYRLLAWVVGAIAILKGLRLPYPWPATQAQIDYRYGFLRRGLFGEVCRQMHIPIWRYGVFTAVAFVLLALFLFLLFRSVQLSGLNTAGAGAFAALMAGSFCISSLVNVVGYYDIVMAVLVLLVMLVRRPRMQLLAAVLAGVVGVLIHESYAIAFLPLPMIAPICAALEAKRMRWLRCLEVAAALLVPFVLALTIAHHAEMTPAQLGPMQAAIRARVDFNLYDPMLEVLLFSSADNLHLMMTYMKAGAWWVEEALGLLAFLPTTLFFLAIAIRLAGNRGRIVQLWLVVCTFAPMLLNLVGFDRYRWLALMTLNASLCMVAVAFANKWRGVLPTDAAAPVFPIAWRHAAMLLLAVNMATDIGLFQGHAKGFPFRDYWTDYRESKQAGQPLLQPKDLFPKRPR